MSNSFSSRRMTGNGSGAYQGWGPRNGLMMTTLCSSIDLVSDSLPKRGLQLVSDIRACEGVRHRRPLDDTHPNVGAVTYQ